MKFLLIKSLKRKIILPPDITLTLSSFQLILVVVIVRCDQERNLCNSDGHWLARWKTLLPLETFKINRKVERWRWNFNLPSQSIPFGTLPVRLPSFIHPRGAEVTIRRFDGCIRSSLPSLDIDVLCNQLKDSNNLIRKSSHCSPVRQFQWIQLVERPSRSRQPTSQPGVIRLPALSLSD